MGTMPEMLPRFAVLGDMKTEREPFRAKSPEPPIPFMILLPAMWVELTLP